MTKFSNFKKVGLEITTAYLVVLTVSGIDSGAIRLMYTLMA